jgi:hypothetical protein
MSLETPPKTPSTTPAEEAKDHIRPVPAEEKPLEPEILESKLREPKFELNPDNSSFFGRMSEAGQTMFKSAHETAFKIPGISRVVGKMEIAYNRHWADNHERKAGELADGILLKNKASEKLAVSETGLKKQVENLKKQGLPTSQIELQIKNLERERVKILNKRDKLQTRFEERENKVKAYTNERDRVADKLINRYESVLGPMEQKIEAAKTARDKMSLESAVMEAKHKQAKENIGKEKTNLEELKDALRLGGLSDRKINKNEAVRIMQDRIDTAYATLEEERESLEKDIRDNERYIADLDKHANPWRDKRDEFVRIKQERPIDFSITNRKREWKPEGQEESSTHTRTETTEPPIYETSADTETKVESSQEDKERPEINVYFVAWSAFLAKKLGGKEKISPQERSQTPADFFNATGLDKDFRLERNSFKKILTQYYKYKKLPMESFTKYIDEFLKQEEIKLPEKQV